MQSSIFKEIAQKMESAADVLLSRLLAEPHNITTIINMVDPAMFAGQHPAFLAIIQQFYEKGRYDPYTIGAKVGDIPGMLEKATRHAETSLDSAFEIYQHTHSQFCALNLHNVAERGVLHGKDAGEICGDMERELKARGAIRKSSAPDGYDDFQKQFDAKLRGIVLDYPVKPFLRAFQEFIPYWEPGTYAIVGGRPGMGKSYWGLQECLYTSMGGKPSTYINLENSPALVYWRLFGMLAGFDYKEPSEKWTPEQMKKAGIARDQLARLKEQKLFESIGPGRKLSNVINSLRADKMERNTQLFVVDYVQLMSNGERTTNAMTEISAELRAFPLETNSVMIAMAQLSREVEKRPMKRPILSDLRESGGLEQDATDVILLWRPGYYNILEDEDGSIFPENYCEAIVAKSRNFGHCVIKGRFDWVNGFHDTPPPTLPEFDPEPFNPKPSFSNQPLPRPNLDADVPF